MNPTRPLGRNVDCFRKSVPEKMRPREAKLPPCTKGTKKAKKRKKKRGK